MAQVNYPELGGVHEQTRFYTEGEKFEHPSGAVYQVQDGKWVLIQKPGEERQP